MRNSTIIRNEIAELKTTINFADPVQVYSEIRELEAELVELYKS